MKGVGVMIQELWGGRGAEHLLDAIAKEKEIVKLWLGDEDNELHFRFNDGTGFKMWDDGQSCCESRYMRTDDDLSYFVGSKLLSAEIADAPTTTSQYGKEHEVQFLHVKTSKGTFTMSSHNEHNGYYGGFWIKVTPEDR